MDAHAKTDPIDELTRQRKRFKTASEAVATITLDKIANDRAGRKIADALARAVADRDEALSAVTRLEADEDAPAAKPEARVTIFHGGKPVAEGDTPAA